MQFLFWCAQEHQDMRQVLLTRLPEFCSLHSLFWPGVPMVWVSTSSSLPWLVLDLPTVSDALKICARSVSTKFCVQLWAEGISVKHCLDNLAIFPFHEHKKLFDKESSYKVHVESYMRKLSQEDKVARIENITCLPVMGPVRLKDPDVTFAYMEFSGLDNNQLSEEPVKVMFGLLVGRGQRDKITRLNIRERKYIGNTTMDPQLALLMANLAKVEEGKMVMDPFVGTGSLLIAAAEFGGMVMGADMDKDTLHASTKPSRVGVKVRARGESLVANFEQYGLASKFGGVVVADFSQSPWRGSPWLDCIVTDPPYGIREVISRTQSQQYLLDQLVMDLLNFSVEQLVVGGRLAFWLPVIREEYNEKDLVPTHTALRLVADCEQVLSGHTSRRLLVMQRVEGKVGDGLASVSTKLGEYKDQFYLTPLAEKKLSEQGKGNLNMSQEMMEKFSNVAIAPVNVTQD
eukprot:GFUD01040564.1.p1 GENE.GFUD01040564.1~~GFUD01040564.1.p1  ORF type:complete len:475 (+),score=188.80 GFUD01040564.1:50-1426(+)